jgi:endonuclease III
MQDIDYPSAQCYSVLRNNYLNRKEAKQKRQMPASDLTVDTFLILRNAFFNADGSPRAFSLRDKKNTQDDPLDVQIATLLSQHLTDAVCQRAPGRLLALIWSFIAIIAAIKPRVNF